MQVQQQCISHRIKGLCWVGLVVSMSTPHTVGRGYKLPPCMTRRSPGINRKSRVLYPHPGFLSSATWPSMPKKHYNGLINQLINQN